jgi:hypothetical protein
MRRDQRLQHRGARFQALKRFPFALAVLTVCLLFPARSFATPILVQGSSFPDEASATGDLTLTANVLTLTLKNTSLFDGRITGIGFDLFAGDVVGKTGLDGYTGNSPGKFTFTDGDLKNVPQFNVAVLDFGWVTSNNGGFGGGSPNDGIAPTDTLVFTVTGPFFGLTEAQLAEALFVRFQRVGADGKGSDVGRGSVPVTEPATMILVGAGVLVFVRRVRKYQYQK